jgi:hypothetical protein
MAYHFRNDTGNYLLWWCIGLAIFYVFFSIKLLFHKRKHKHAKSRHRQPSHHG